MQDCGRTLQMLGVGPDLCWVEGLEYVSYSSLYLNVSVKEVILHGLYVDCVSVFQTIDDSCL